jgi:outer membrane lipoprotein-sorting protein
MNERLDDNTKRAHNAFGRDHDRLRAELLNALPKRQTKPKSLRRPWPVQRFSKGTTMNSKTVKLAAAAAILIAASLGIHFLGGSVDGTGVAWADVLRNVEAARTVMYRRQFETPDRREVALHRVIDPYLRRSDVIEGSDEYSASMGNTQINKRWTLYPRTKVAVMSDDEGFPGLRLDTYDRLKRDLRDGTERDLGPVKLNGCETICFEITTESSKTTVWADPNTALPIQIETVSDANGPTKTLMSDIQFDVELDERLFEPPADYSIVDLDTQKMTTPFELTEQHLIDGLAVYPKYLGGKFCTRYIGGRPLTDEVRAKCATEAERLDWSEQESFQSTLGCAFVEQLPADGDYQYLGEDVQFGDATKAVCWYRPAGSDTYRVIYGDLSVRDVEPDDLPPIPWLVQDK